MKVRRRSRLALAVIPFAALLLGAQPLAAQEQPVAFGDSDAESLVLLHGYYPGYWWDHTDLTVAVLAAPNEDPVFVDAIRDAIAT